MSENKDYWPSESELKHYEKCSDGVVAMQTVHRLIRMIRQLQSEIKQPGVGGSSEYREENDLTGHQGN